MLRTFFLLFGVKYRSTKYVIHTKSCEVARNPKIKQVSSHNFDQLLCRPKDDSKLPAKKKMFETKISKFFLERATISNFFCASNQNNLRKYVS